MIVSAPENKVILFSLYLDDVYCTNHETDSSYIEAYYDKGYEKYFYVAQFGCKDKNELLLGSKEGLILTLESERESIISSYPESKSKFDSMLKKLRKFKP